MASNNSTTAKNIWLVTREYGNLAGAGGVKDVTKQLAAALAAGGHQVSVILPCYGFINPKKLGFAPLGHDFDVDMSYVLSERREFVKIWHSPENPTIYLIDSRRFQEKFGVYTYSAEEEARNPDHVYGQGHFDYFAMNVLLQKVALSLMVRLGQQPDVIHCHDGHTALIPAMIREIEGFRHYFHKTAAVVTIHNAGLGYHQEVADLPFAQAITGLPMRVIDHNLLDGAFDPLLAASGYGAVNTVSENYARELRETFDDEATGWLGHRLMSRGIRLAGITNGIDPREFDLTKPKELGLPAGFSPASPKKNGHPGKRTCRQDLLAALRDRTLRGIRQDGFLHTLTKAPLFTFIGRLTAQKGVDKLIAAAKKILPIDQNLQILILGSGEKVFEDELVRLAVDPRMEGRICVLRGYDPILANRIYAAGDFFLVPSRYEPCGLTDFIAQLFGNLPIVHHIGGLVKVIDGETGFAYRDGAGAGLSETMVRAGRVFHDSPQQIMLMQKTAVELIQSRYTWEKVMHQYLELYQKSAVAR